MINWSEVYGIMKPMVLFVLGMVVYALFVFKFYRLLARRDIFKLNLQEKYGGVRKFFGTILYAIEYLLVFPLFVFLWFAVISALLMIMAKDQTTGGILLISIGLVSSVRITAYYREALSQDLAKMLPFALLGIFLVDISYFSWQSSLELLKQAPNFWKEIIYYLVFLIALEFVLRIVSIFLPKKEEEEEKKKK